MRSADFGAPSRAIDMRDDRLPRFEKTRCISRSARISMPSASRISRMAAETSSSSRCSQARTHLDDGHFAPESAEHLPELQPDIAAAHDDQVRRKIVDVHASELLVR